MTTVPVQNLTNLETRARQLSAMMPGLLVNARKIATTLIHGTHGRKRAGPGETFWQFRPYGNLEPAHRIDWRRSASSDQLFVRENEWDTAHTFWIWIDLNPSMWFQSREAKMTKAERACLLGLALAEVLVRSGERVGVLGTKRPSMARDIVEQIAERLLFGMKNGAFETGLPPSQRVRRFSEVILISDFLGDEAELIQQIQQFGGRQVSGALMHIIDPVEESFPFAGRVEFEDMQQAERIVIENAQESRVAYQAAFSGRKAKLEAVCQPLNWGYLQHHTDRTARQGLLHLYGFLSSHTYGAASAAELDQATKNSVDDRSFKKAFQSTLKLANVRGRL